MGDKPDQNKLPHWSNRHIWQFPFVRDLFWILIAVGLVLLGFYLRPVFTPVLIALVLAYLIDPLITWAEDEYGWKRPVTISALLGALAVVLLVVLFFLGSTIVGQVVQLVENVPRYVEEVGNLVDRVSEQIEAEHGAEVEGGEAGATAGAGGDGAKDEAAAGGRDHWDNLMQRVRENPAETVLPAVRWIIAGSGPVAGAMTRLFGTLTYVVITLGLIPIYFFFFAWHLHPMYRTVEQYIPASRKERTLEILQKMDVAVANFFRDRVIISAICGVLAMIGFWAVGVPYWFLLGLAFGVLNLIPYAAVFIWPAAILAAYMNTLNGGDPAATEAAEAVSQGFPWLYVLVGPTAVYAVIQFIDGWLLTPWIQGKSTEMSAVTILIVVFIGGAIGGLYGMLLCIPVAACIKILLNELFLPRLKKIADEH